MNKKIKKIEESTLRILKNFNPALISSLSTLGLLNPVFLPLVAISQAVLGYYGEYANNKTIDLLKEFKKNENKINQEIFKSDKFKASFIKIIGDNITEGNEEKRQYLKNYILNFAFGVEPDFNEHTKLINILNNITLEEVAVLKLWDEDGLINKNVKYKDIGRITTAEIRHVALDTRSPANGNILENYEKYIFELTDNKDKLNQILLSLGYQDLLYVVSENNFGSGQEAKVKDITKFGKIFLNFIK